MLKVGFAEFLPSSQSKYEMLINEISYYTKDHQKNHALCFFFHSFPDCSNF